MIAPAHQMFIPEIGGEALKSVEMTVNGILKLALWAKSKELDRLIIISPKAPLLHHRFSAAGGETLERHFEDNQGKGKQVDLTFDVDESFLKILTIQANDKKVQLDVYREEAGPVSAIDNGSLSFLYYAKEVGLLPHVVLLGLSDLGEEHYKNYGRAISDTLKVEQGTTGLLALGEGLEYGSLSHSFGLMKHILDAHNIELPPFHELSNEVVDETAFLTGFYE